MRSDNLTQTVIQNFSKQFPQGPVIHTVIHKLSINKLLKNIKDQIYCIYAEQFLQVVHAGEDIGFVPGG